MTQNYPQCENRLSESELKWKDEVCSIPGMKRVDLEPTASLNEENELIGSWKPKMWTLFIGISQLFVCTFGLAVVFMFGKDKLGEWLMLYFESDDNQGFFKGIVTFLIVLFSNGIFWGFLLYLGTKYESVYILTIWLIAEFLALIVTGVAFILALRAYISYIETLFVPPSTVLPITCVLLIGHLLGQVRLWLVFLFVQQCESHLALERDVASEI